MVYTGLLLMLLTIPLYLRRVGMEWLWKRRDVGLFIFLFSKSLWWFLIYLILSDWLDVPSLYLLVGLSVVALHRFYQERLLYQPKK